MAFTIYKSSDTDSPIMYGTTGSVLAVLNACLVNGYGSKPAAGWTKPYADAGSGSISVGCYLQNGGANARLVINDDGPNTSAGRKEAWATGWEYLADLSASVKNTVGSGSGQFPTPAQLLTNGHVVIRKSATEDSSSVRSWVVAADATTMYMFIQTGDAANTYYGFGFGDIYSFKTGSNDDYRCIIMGRISENNATVTQDGFDYCSSGWNTAVGGNFMPRSYSQLGTSITIAKHGDSIKGNANFFYGVVQMPNSTDNAIYISPVWVVEGGTNVIRGQLRGLYQPLHAVANFSDGQEWSGSLDYNAKTFMVLKTTPNSGMYVLETSDTLSTN